MKIKNKNFKHNKIRRKRNMNKIAKDLVRIAKEIIADDY